MFVLIHGLTRSEKSAVEFTAHIVYGNPRIEAVEIGKNFIALVEFPKDQDTAATATFERMYSFSGLGAQLIGQLDVALREFGVWCRHYAPGTVVGVEEIPAEYATTARSPENVETLNDLERRIYTHEVHHA